jgi:hypothetical protein
MTRGADTNQVQSPRRAKKPAKVRWTCPNACPAVLGPKRPRRDDVSRYCLSCSAKKGRLVERSAPSLEKRKADAARRLAEKRERAKRRADERLTVRWTAGDVDLRTAFKLALRLPSLRSAKPGLSLDDFSLYRTSKYPVQVSGQTNGHTLHLTVGVDANAGDAVGVLIHELAHMACFADGQPWGDADDAFGRRCLRARDEWNERNSNIATLDRNGRGVPYRGEYGRMVARRRAQSQSE